MNNAIKVIVTLNSMNTKYSMVFVKSVYSVEKAIETTINKINKKFENTEWYVVKAIAYETYMNNNGCTPNFDERTALKIMEMIVA